MRAPIVLMICGSLMLASGGCDRRSGEAGQGGPPPSANAGGAISTDEVQPSAEEAGAQHEFQHKIDRSQAGKPMPAGEITDAAGRTVTLARVANGKPLLVNLWATWCAPCIAELPALEKVAGGGAGITVLAVSQDAEGTKSVEPFLVKRGLKALPVALDTKNELGFAYGTGVLPTTVLYDGKGKEVLRVIGALDWAGDDGRALIAEALK